MGKILNLIFRSFQNNPHLSYKFEHFWNFENCLSMNLSIWLINKFFLGRGSAPTPPVTLSHVLHNTVNSLPKVDHNNFTYNTKTAKD